MRIITSFSGANAFLSNFADADVKLDGVVFHTTEAAFQAAKTTDNRMRGPIQFAKTPGEAKKLGRKVPLRPDWEKIKVDVMLGLLRQKFKAGTELARKLDDTGHAILVEGTTWHDKFWGVCTCEKCKGKGVNMLGQLLMKVRAENRGHPLGFIHDEVRTDWVFGGPYTISERQ